MREINCVELNSMMNHLEDNDPYIRWAAEQAITTLSGKSALKYFENNLDNPLEYKRAMSIKMLSKIEKSDNILSKIILKLEDESEMVSNQAAIAIGKIIGNDYEKFINSVFIEEEKTIREMLFELLDEVFQGDRANAIAFVLKNKDKDISLKAKQKVMKMVKTKTRKSKTTKTKTRKNKITKTKTKKKK